MNNEDNKNQNNLNPNKLVNTLPGKNLIDNSQKLNLNTTLEKKSISSKKYSLTATLFIVGLILVSVTKNETRNLQKEISILQTSINNLQLELHQAIIEHEVITSPENIAKLAKEHLDSDFNTYKKSQINQLTTNEETLVKLSKINKKLIEEKNNAKNKKIRKEVAKRIEITKTEIRKLQDLYQSPEKLPEEIRRQVAAKIKTKKNELQNLYSDPIGLVTSSKVHKWVGIQVVKLFLGIPIVPGK